MSAKNRDEHNRWRNITVGFRVSPEENELLNRAVALSGLAKQEYRATFESYLLGYAKNVFFHRLP